MKKLFFISGCVLSITLFSFTVLDKKANAKRAMKTLEGFCNYVPSGYAVIEDDTMSVHAFYMSETEITNIQYMEFLHDLKKQGKIEQLQTAMIDTLAWNTEYGENNAMVNFYHDHPAYHNYPVVNISKEGAELYCQWLSEKYKELSGGELQLQFRIPTRAEWMRAARGSNHYYEYTWGGPYLRNSKGCYLANFLGLGAENIKRNSDTGALEVTVRNYNAGVDNSFLTASAHSYYPNDFGFYNMNGNVSEMISDSDHAVGGDWMSPGYDIRNESIKEFTKPSPTVGFRVVASYIQPAK